MGVGDKEEQGSAAIPQNHTTQEWPSQDGAQPGCTGAQHVVPGALPCVAVKCQQPCFLVALPVETQLFESIPEKEIL